MKHIGERSERTMHQVVEELTARCQVREDNLTVVAFWRGSQVEAYGIKQAWNGKRAKQIRWYIDGKVTSKKKLLALQP